MGNKSHEGKDAIAVVNCAAHSLNNSINVLYAAAEYLEDAEPSTFSSSASRALNRSIVKLISVSAALSLSAISDEDLDQFEKGRPFPTSSTELRNLLKKIEYTNAAKVENEISETQDLGLPVDTTTLYQLLLCICSYVVTTGNDIGQVTLKWCNTEEFQRLDIELLFSQKLAPHIIEMETKDTNLMALQLAQTWFPSVGILVEQVGESKIVLSMQTDQ